MHDMGIHEAKRNCPRQAKRVAQTGEPGEPTVGTGSTIWGLRDRFIKEHGTPEEDLELPPRPVEQRETPF